MLDIDDEPETAARAAPAVPAAPAAPAALAPPPVTDTAGTHTPRLPDTPGLRLVAVLGQVLGDTPLVRKRPRLCALTDAKATIARAQREAPAPYKEAAAPAARQACAAAEVSVPDEAPQPRRADEAHQPAGGPGENAAHQSRETRETQEAKTAAAPASAKPAHIRLVAPAAKPDHIPPGASLAYNLPQACSNDGTPRGRSRAEASHAHARGAPPREPAGDAQTPAPLPPIGPAALLRAVDVCGSQSALASAIGLTQAHVWNWLNRGRVPAEHCPAIERATQRAVRCELLRPDVDWAYLRLASGDGGSNGDGGSGSDSDSNVSEAASAEEDAAR